MLLEEGDDCPVCGKGCFAFKIENCSCHINPPCPACENAALYCSRCDTPVSEFNKEENMINPLLNITTPIYTLDTVSDACLDYMQNFGVDVATNERMNVNKGIVYRPDINKILHNPNIAARDGRKKLSKEQFYETIGFIDTEVEFDKVNNTPLFGKELINKYRNK